VPIIARQSRQKWWARLRFAHPTIIVTHNDWSSPQCHGMPLQIKVRRDRTDEWGLKPMRFNGKTWERFGALPRACL
jgi:hypothetical protein